MTSVLKTVLYILRVVLKIESIVNLINSLFMFCSDTIYLYTYSYYLFLDILTSFQKSTYLQLRQTYYFRVQSSIFIKVY
jgi:hypothetical protein